MLPIFHSPVILFSLLNCIVWIRIILCLIHWADTVSDPILTMSHPLRERHIVFPMVVCPSVYDCNSVSMCVRLSIHHKLCQLHNSKTVQDIFTKLGTNIDHDLGKLREEELLLDFLFNGIMPIVIFCIIIVSAV